MDENKYDKIYKKVVARISAMNIPYEIDFNTLEVSEIKDKTDKITVTSDVTCSNQITKVVCIVAHFSHDMCLKICHNDF